VDDGLGNGVKPGKVVQIESGGSAGRGPCFGRERKNGGKKRKFKERKRVKNDSTKKRTENTGCRLKKARGGRRI